MLQPRSGRAKMIERYEDAFKQLGIIESKVPYLVRSILYFVQKGVEFAEYE